MSPRSVGHTDEEAFLSCGAWDIEGIVRGLPQAPVTISPYTPADKVTMSGRVSLPDDVLVCIDTHLGFSGRLLSRRLLRGS